LSNKESHQIRNGIIVTVVGGILLTFLAPFRQLVITTLSWFWELLKLFSVWLSSGQNIYGWILLLLAMLAVPTIIKLATLVVPDKERGVEELYKSDNLFGVSWGWSYSNGSINNLWCLCPTCQSELVYSEFEPNPYDYTHDGFEAKTEFTCERCNTIKCSLKGVKDYALGTIKREIRRKIRNNEWQPKENS